MALNNYQDADFTPSISPSDVRPSMGTYNTPQTFRFWCQKVLPLVYDDSLSYYELLCKVVDYLNNTMEDVNTAVEDVTNLNSAFGSLENHVNASETALVQAYNDLQDYVNSYFNNLDVQEEINNKLDIMAEDGTLDTILLPYFNAYKVEIDQEVNNMSNLVNTIDSSLSQEIIAREQADIVLGNRMDSFTQLPSGSTAGDAELIDIRTGFEGAEFNSAGESVRGQINYVNSIDKQISYLVSKLLEINLFPTSGYTDGKYLNYNNGTESTNANFFYTDFIPVLNGQYYITSIQTAHVCYYNSKKQYVSGTLINAQSSNVLLIPATVCYMRISANIVGRTNYELFVGNELTTTATQQLKSNILDNLNYNNPTVVNPNTYATLLPDLDDAPINNTYLLLFPQFSITDIPSNMPYGIYYEPCVLTTFQAGSYKIQYARTNTGAFIRICVSGTWYEWYTHKKPTIDISHVIYLIRLIESGLPCKINLKTNVELYSGYISAKGNDYWTNYSGYSQSGDRNDSGLYLHPHVEFNGNGHTVSFTPVEKTVAMMRDFSPFNLGGDNTLENVIIDIGVRNCRYAIHDDFAITTEGIIIKNIVMKGTGVSDALIGAGVKPYCTHVVENCVCLDAKIVYCFFYFFCIYYHKSII